MYTEYTSVDDRKRGYEKRHHHRRPSSWWWWSSWLWGSSRCPPPLFRVPEQWILFTAHFWVTQPFRFAIVSGAVLRSLPARENSGRRLSSVSRRRETLDCSPWPVTRACPWPPLSSSDKRLEVNLHDFSGTNRPYVSPAISFLHSCGSSGSIANRRTIYLQCLRRDLRYLLSDFYYLQGRCCWITVANGKLVARSCILSYFLLCFQRSWCPFWIIVINAKLAVRCLSNKGNNGTCEMEYGRSGERPSFTVVYKHAWFKFAFRIYDGFNFNNDRS